MKLTKICVKKWVEIFSKFAELIVLNPIRLSRHYKYKRHKQCLNILLHNVIKLLHYEH